MKQLVDMYQFGKNKRFYQNYGDNYLFLLRNLEKSVHYFGPEAYCHKEDIYKTVSCFLERSFSKEMREDFESYIERNIYLYTKEELEEILNIYEYRDVEKIKKLPISYHFALYLLRSRAYTFYVDSNHFEIGVHTNLTFGSCISLLHEWIHKINGDHGITMVDDYIILDELLAYYGTFLFEEFCEREGKIYDAKLAIDQVDTVIFDRIHAFQKVEQVIASIPVEKEKEIIDFLSHDTSFALNDYEHILGYVLATYFYQKQEGKSLEEKTEWLQRMICYPSFLHELFEEVMTLDCIDQKILEKCVNKNG